MSAVREAPVYNIWAHIQQVGVPCSGPAWTHDVRDQLTSVSPCPVPVSPAACGALCLWSNLEPSAAQQDAPAAHMLHASGLVDTVTTTYRCMQPWQPPYR